MTKLIDTQAKLEIVKRFNRDKENGKNTHETVSTIVKEYGISKSALYRWRSQLAGKNGPNRADRRTFQRRITQSPRHNYREDRVTERRVMSTKSQIFITRANIQWPCPKCQYVNNDWADRYGIVQCGCCQRRYSWEELLGADKYYKLTSLLKPYKGTTT